MSDILVSLDTNVSVNPGGVFHVKGIEGIDTGLSVSPGGEFFFEITTLEKSQADSVGITSDVTQSRLVSRSPSATNRVGSALGLLRRMPRPTSNDVGIESAFKRIKPETIVSSVGVSVEALALALRPFTSRVGVGSTFALRRIIQRTISTTSGVGSGLLARFPRRYCSLTTIGSRSQVRLTYPYVSPTSTLDFHPPKFGNTEALDTGALNQQTMNGIVTQIRPTTWNNIKIISLSFDYLSDAIFQDLIQFMKDSRGKEIGYLDHEDRQWRGFIIDPEVSLSSDFTACSNRISFKIRGSLV